MITLDVLHHWTLGALALTIPLAAWPLGPQDRPVDPARLGPQVGERVPDFEGIDQHGRRQTLASVLGPSGAMLVFNRSADW